jgi:hypothetical protein
VRFTVLQIIWLSFLGLGSFTAGILLFIYGLKRTINWEPFDRKYAHADPRISLPCGLMLMFGGVYALYEVLANLF